MCLFEVSTASKNKTVVVCIFPVPLPCGGPAVGDRIFRVIPPIDRGDRATIAIDRPPHKRRTLGGDIYLYNPCVCVHRAALNKRFSADSARRFVGRVARASARARAVTAARATAARLRARNCGEWEHTHSSHCTRRQFPCARPNNAQKHPAHTQILHKTGSRVFFV